MTAPGGAGVDPGPSGDFYAEYQATQLRRKLAELFGATVPFHFVDKCVALVLTEDFPLVTPAAHSAAVRREIDWQHHWLAKWQAADIEAGKLRRALDLTGKLTPHERARRANAALTTEQRSAAGKARAAMLHHPTTLARRIAKAWPELSDEDRRAVRRELRAAGVIT